MTGAYLKAGIQIGGSGTTLTIKGDGSLTANGGNQSAGIGLSRAWDVDATGGDIIIEGGNITATGNDYGAGIGTGVSWCNTSDKTATIGNITIKGGSVRAIGGTNQFNPGSGIGKGGAYSYGHAVVGTITIYDGIDMVDASSISESVTYIHDETDVTANASNYFTITEDGDRRIIAPKDDTDYTITIADDIEHGTLTGAATAKYMEKVTITATPDLGYRLIRLVVMDADNNDVATTGNSFFMPKGDVTVSAVFEQGTHGTTEFAWGYSTGPNPTDEVRETIYDGVTTVNIQETGQNVYTGTSYTIRKYEGNTYYNFRLDNNEDGQAIPFTGTGEFVYNYNPTAFYVTDNNELGFYDITMTDVGNGKWSVSIQKTVPVVADIPDRTYTGSEITPEPLVLAGSLSLTNGTDYEYSYSDNTNVGTAKVTVTFKGDYASLGSVEKEFKIVKATPTVTAPTAKTLTYNGNEQELVTAGSTNFGKVLYSLDGDTYSEKVPKGTNAGKYTVYYKVDTDNYYYAPQKVEVTIAESYTITWKNGDETLETDNYVPGGATPEYNGETPTKADDTMYSYSFAGWSPEISDVTGNVTYTAQFSSTAKSYTITYKVDGEVYGAVDTVAYGTALTAREAPTKTGYTFSGWSEIPATMPDEDVVITGSFIINKYAVTWKNGDTVLETDENVEYGTNPEYNGETPTKNATAQYTYTFSGWSPTIDAVTGNVTYTAQFSETVNEYTVTWKNGDTILETDENVEYGATPEYNGEIPTKAGNAQYTYTFSGWSPAVDTVTGNVTYTAQFSETVNKYTITWENFDGSVLKTEQVEYGITPVFSGETPTREANAQCTYTFKCWKDNWYTYYPGESFGTVRGNITYTAAFDFTINVYTVKWVDGDGNILETENVKYGRTPTAYNGDTPTKTADAQYTYTFSGWDNELSEVTGETTYTAQFDSTVNKYTVTWKNGDTVLETDSDVPYGTTPTYDGETPTKTADAMYTYSFAGWSPSVSPVNGDVTYTAQFNSTAKTYTITYKVDGEVYVTKTVSYGNSIALPDAPTKEGYTFSGWQISYTTMPASNIEITGTFTINTYAVNFVDADGVTALADIQTVGWNEKASAPAAPTKNGAIFLGWTADGVNAYDFETPVTAETTLTAMWLDASGFITFSEGYAVTDNKFNGTDRDYVGFRFAVNMDNSNYTVVQHGILYGMNVGAFGNGQADANLRFTDDSASALMDKVREFAALNTDTETTDWIEVYIGDSRDGVVYARGFIIVTDGTNKYLIYSDVQQGSYNSFSE